MHARCTTQLNTCPPPTSSSPLFALLSNPSQAHPKPKKKPADELPTISASHRIELPSTTRGDDTSHTSYSMMSGKWEDHLRSPLTLATHFTLIYDGSPRWWSFELWVRPLWEFYHFYITPNLIDSNSFGSVVCFSALICLKPSWIARAVMDKSWNTSTLVMSSGLRFSHPWAALY